MEPSASHEHHHLRPVSDGLQALVDRHLAEVRAALLANQERLLGLVAGQLQAACLEAQAARSNANGGDGCYTWLSPERREAGSPPSGPLRSKASGDVPWGGDGTSTPTSGSQASNGKQKPETSKTRVAPVVDEDLPTHRLSALTTPQRPHIETNRNQTMVQRVSNAYKLFRSGQESNSVFDLKESVKSLMAKTEYHVAMFYNDTGVCQRIARSTRFEMITFLVIFLNAVWLAYDADMNHAALLYDAEVQFQVVENVFCTFYVAELLIRFVAFKNKRNCFRDAWFVFDFSLVALMVVETWVVTLLLLIGLFESKGIGAQTTILRIFRLVKLARTARVARLLRAVPELLILVKAMAVGCRCVLFTLVLLLIIVYIFAILSVQLSNGTQIGDEYFKNVFFAMSKLVLELGVFPDQATGIRAIAEADPVLGFFILLFCAAAVLSIMNILIGMQCQVVAQIAMVERDILQTDGAREKVKYIYDKMDLDGDGLLSTREFEKLFQNAGALQSLQEIGVDIMSLIDMQPALFAEGRSLRFHDFFEILLTLRRSNHAKVKDIVRIFEKLTDMEKMTARLLSQHDPKTTTGRTASQHPPAFPAEPPADAVLSLAAEAPWHAPAAPCAAPPRMMSVSLEEV